MEETVTLSGDETRRFRRRNRFSSEETRRLCVLIHQQNINHKWWRRRRLDFEGDGHSSDTACSSFTWPQYQEAVSPTNAYSNIRVHKYLRSDDDSDDDSKTVFHGHNNKVLLYSSLTTNNCLKQQQQPYDSDRGNHWLRTRCSRLKSKQALEEWRKQDFLGSMPRIICLAVLLLLVPPMTLSVHVLNASFTGNNSQRHFDAADTIAHIGPPETGEERIGKLNGSDFVDEERQDRLFGAAKTSSRLMSTKITSTTAKPTAAVKNYSTTGSLIAPKKLLTEKEAFLRAANVPIIDMRPGPGSTSYFHSHEDEDFASLLYIKVSEESWRSYVQFKKDTCRDVDEENIAGRVVNSTENGYFSWEENSFHQELRKIIFPETNKGSLRSLIGTPLLRSLDPRFFASTPDSLCKAQELQSDAEILKKAEENQFEDFLINKILHPSILSLPRVRKTNCTSSATATAANSTEAALAAAVTCNGAAKGGAGALAKWNGTEKVTTTIATSTLTTTTIRMSGAVVIQTPPTASPTTSTKATNSGGGTSSGTTTVRISDSITITDSSSITLTTTIPSTSQSLLSSQLSSALPTQAASTIDGSSPSTTSLDPPQTLSPPIHHMRVL